jgi:hypothetical protein
MGDESRAVAVIDAGPPKPVEAVELLKGRLEKVPSNGQFLTSMNLD